MNNKKKIFLNGLFFENPIFVVFLGMCPALGTTSRVEDAFYMSLCVVMVLLLSNTSISLIRKIIPNEVRIPIYIIIIATIVSVVDMIFHAYLKYSIYQSLGSFISLIVVNCIVLARAETFSSKNNVLDSIIDALGFGLGFAFALIIVALFRELVGTGYLMWNGQSIDLFSKYKISLFIDNAGAFISLGLLVAIYNLIIRRETR